jgi:DNA-binding CsgD family transcriptional regulator
MRIAGTQAAVWTPATLKIVLNAPAAEQAFGKTQGSTFSQLSGLGERVVSVPGWRDCWTAPIVDSLGLISRDATGRGVAVCVGLAETATVNAREARLLLRLATHVGASARLRSSEGTRRLEDADVVLSPRGKVVHASDEKHLRAEPLRDGLERRNFARKSRHDAEKALEVWQGLVAGRWSIVDHFDTDGKRFVLAMKNAPEVDAREGLPPEERRVASLAAMGHRDKEIAYMLGITPARVAASLRRVRAALRVNTRAELAAVWRRGTTE